jgi:hypothetical protein
MKNAHPKPKQTLNLLRTAMSPKKTNRKTKLQQKVENVYKDVLLPNRDEREPEPVSADDPVFLGDRPMGDESFPVSAPQKLSGDELQQIMTEKMFKLGRQVIEADKAAKEGEMPRRPLKRPPGNSGPIGVLTQARDSLRKMVEMYLNEGKYDSVVKYASWAKEVDDLLHGVMPKITPSRQTPLKIIVDRPTRISKIEH